MQRVIAVVADVLLATILAYGGFRLGQALAPCPDPADCFTQIPLGIGGAVIPIIAYFAIGYRIWGMTPGEKAAGLSQDAS